MKDTLLLFSKFSLTFLGALAIVWIIGAKIDFADHILLILSILLFQFVLAFIMTKSRK